MAENNLQLVTPFGFTFGQDLVTEDLSELKSNNLFANGVKQGSNPSSGEENPFYILKKYPHSKEILLKYFYKFSDAFYNRRINFKITTSWAVKLTKGESVHFHNHVNCMWSAVYYYGEYTANSCPLSFQNPIRGLNPLSIDSASGIHNPMNTDISVIPQTNMIIFFPSWIYHFSDLNQETTRYSLAFNLMPSDTIGMGDSTYNPRMMIDGRNS